jgi:hypothetical protein
MPSAWHGPDMIGLGFPVSLATTLLNESHAPTPAARPASYGTYVRSPQRGAGPHHPGGHATLERAKDRTLMASLEGCA